MFYSGLWGTICDDSWDVNDAEVVCRSLGFLIAKEAKTRAFFGQGSGNIWLDDVACTGTESDLNGCTHNGWGVGDCDHREDAGVVCSGNMSDDYMSISVEI